MRIRQGDLAVLFLCVVRYACIMPMSSGMFGFFYVLCEEAVGQMLASANACVYVCAQVGVL